MSSVLFLANNEINIRLRQKQQSCHSFIKFNFEHFQGEISQSTQSPLSSHNVHNAHTYPMLRLHQPMKKHEEDGKWPRNPSIASLPITTIRILDSGWEFLNKFSIFHSNIASPTSFEYHFMCYSTSYEFSVRNFSFFFCYFVHWRKRSEEKGLRLFQPSHWIFMKLFTVNYLQYCMVNGEWRINKNLES